MDAQILTSKLDVIERHSRAMFAELREVVASDRVLTRTNPSPATEQALPGASWQEVERRFHQTYSWPPDAGGDEEYDPFIVYRSNGSGMLLALAHNIAPTLVKGRERKQIWVFQLGEGGGSKRPITPFVAADDYEETGALVAIIRGKGDTGRQMYDPGDTLPPPYDDLRVETLRERIAGHYNKLAVVAHEQDAESMLRHGAAQIRMRGW